MKTIAKITAIVTLALLLGAGCDSQTGQSSEVPDIAPLPRTVAEYPAFLYTLDTGDMESINSAVAAYQTAFKGATSAENDAGYVQFLKFQQRIEERLNRVVSENPGRYWALATGDSSVKDPAASDLLQRLREYGFQFLFDEGQPLIINDPAYLRRHFYQGFSPAMRDFFDQFESERTQPFAADGALLLPIAEVGQRLIFWETFIDQHPEFLLMEEASLNYGYYLLVLFLGTDNSPAFDRSTQLLKNDFRRVYEGIVRDFPQSSAGAIFERYLELLKKNRWRQTEEIETFVNQFAIF